MRQKSLRFRSAFSEKLKASIKLENLHSHQNIRGASLHLIVVASVGLLLNACAVNNGKTIGSLHNVDIEIKEEYIEDSLEKALVAYENYLKETPETSLTPEAMRRIADLKIKQALKAEEAAIEQSVGSDDVVMLDSDSENSQQNLDAPSALPVSVAVADTVAEVNDKGAVESDAEFEARATASFDISMSNAAVKLPGEESDALLSANAREAIELYRELLAKYPQYERNDQVMYQLSRAYEETGQVEAAMEVLQQLVATYPKSRHIDESWFRLGEFYFTRKKYLDAEEAYGKVVDIGGASSFYELALYKRGWALFKQEMYEMALDDFIAMLDYKVSQSYDFENQTNDVERKHVEDTFRVISLSFSYLGGPESVVDYFYRKGPRQYESLVYSSLGEYYLEKRRYQDAAESYNLFVDRNPLHRKSAEFSIRVIDIYKKGGFPKLVLQAKKDFATTYALDAEYWNVFDITEYGSVVEFLQTNLIDLASHYHSAYQDKRFKDKKEENYNEAIHWYRSYLKSFGDKPRAAEINFQLASLMLENKDFYNAALEYERTAYNYPVNENSSEAGYASVYAFRQYLSENFKGSPQADRAPLLREIIRSSLKFSETFPAHEKAPIIMIGAVEELYGLKDFQNTIDNGHLLLERFPDAEKEIRRSAWVMIAHANFDTEAYVEAERAYMHALEMTAEDAKDRSNLVDNLAASIYQQGDQARKKEDHATAAEHFLRIRDVASNASLLATAEYDAAASLIILQDWARAAEVLNNFRRDFPEHNLAKEVTKKLAVVYEKSGDLLLAAEEFERIEKESDDEEVRREALTRAAELYSVANSKDKALTVLRRYIKLFPSPLEPALETRQKIAEIYKEGGNKNEYMEELREIVRIELRGGNARTDRTRYIAANAALILAEPKFNSFKEIRLVTPLEKNLQEKRRRMKAAISAYTDLIDYRVADVTAAATYYLAEIYYYFSQALKESERPTNLSPMELEEYELALEEQIFPFEEKAITVHEKNIELLGSGIYNQWIEKSIGKLAIMVPARYARVEEAGKYIKTIVPNTPAQEQASVSGSVSVTGG